MFYKIRIRLEWREWSRSLLIIELRTRGKKLKRLRVENNVTPVSFFYSFFLYKLASPSLLKITGKM